MTASLAIHALLGLLPVCAFLAALVYLDSFKLIPARTVLAIIASGAVMGLASYPLNTFGLDHLGLDFRTYTQYPAPLLEEALKAAVIVALMRLNRIGFLVDAAVAGFAVGAGFALFENLFYLRAMPDMPMASWIVRGFGTAIMHGGATALFAVVSHRLCEQYPRRTIVALLPGFGLAVLLHAIYNQFFFAPIVNTLLILVILPLVFSAVFNESERATREWLGMGFDADAELLQLINSGEFSNSRVGRYLDSLKQNFEGTVVVDLLCYLRLHTELSMRAKGLLMLRAQGFDDKPGEMTRAKLEELRYLESSIGKTGLLAIRPFLQLSGKDLWKIYVLSS